MQEIFLNSYDLKKIETIFSTWNGSSMWNFSISSRKIITDFVSLEVHNGESLKFWDDSWYGLPLPAFDNDLREVINIIKENWGVFSVHPVLIVEIFKGKVICQFLIGRNMIHKIMWKRHSWPMKMISRFGLPHPMMNIQLKLVLDHWNQWSKMKQATNYWNKIIFQNAGYIACLALWKKTLNSDMLHKFNRSHLFQCVSCSESIENIYHLFNRCQITRCLHQEFVLDIILNLKVIHIKGGDF